MFKFILPCLLLSAPCYANIDIILPTHNGSIEKFADSYEAPYKKNTSLFMLDGDLHYLDESTEKGSPLEVLSTLSTNHFIALNKRDRKKALETSYKMLNYLINNAEIEKTTVSSDIYNRLFAFKNRVIEQISMFIDNINHISNMKDKSPLMDENITELQVLYKTAKFITGTHLLFQLYSYDTLYNYNIPANLQLIYSSTLDLCNKSGNKLIGSILEEHPDNDELIETAITLKKQEYASYLQYIYNKFNSTSIKQYTSVDKGQTSEDSNNTCFYNSVFYGDLATSSISSTKKGALERGEKYLAQFIERCKKIQADCPIEEACASNLKNNSKKKTEEALYGFTASIYDDAIFPGVFGDSAGTEFLCHACLLNLAIFPKNYMGGSDSLLSFFGAGFFGSENFPIAPISCSYSHAQALVKTTDLQNQPVIRTPKKSTIQQNTPRLVPNDVVPVVKKKTTQVLSATEKKEQPKVLINNFVPVVKKKTTQVISAPQKKEQPKVIMSSIPITKSKVQVLASTNNPQKLSTIQAPKILRK